MNTFDISSANSSAVLIVEGLFPTGIELQMFSSDSALDMSSVDTAETRIGVDGHMVAGYKPMLFPVTINLEAASPSFKALASVWEAMRINKRVYNCTLVCTLPSIGKVFTWSVGVMKSGTPFPKMGQLLDPTSWTFEFQNMDTISIG